MPRNHKLDRRRINFKRYSWRDKADFGWTIYDGPNLFLVAEGSGWSRPVGRELYRQLVNKHLHRTK